MSMHSRVSGIWKEITEAHVNVTGTWKKITEGLVNVSGTWKQFYTAESIPEDIIIFRTSSTSPGNDWIIADGTNSTPDVTNGTRVCRISSTTLATGGNATHTDSFTGNTASIANPAAGNSKNKNAPCALQTSHLHVATHSHISNNDPDRVSFVPFIGGTKMPAGTLVLYAGTDNPSWGTEDTSYEGSIVAFGDTFSTSGNSNHIASYTGFAGYANNTYSTLGWFVVEGEYAAHRHAIDHSHTGVDITPLSTRLRLIGVDSEMSIVESNMCFLTAASTTPDGFTDITATHSGKCLYISATNTLVNIGSDTHTHASESFTTGAVVNKTDSGTLALPLPAYASIPHTHTFAHSHSAVTHVPEYITLRLIRKD